MKQKRELGKHFEYRLTEVDGRLRNKKNPNHKDIVEKLIKSFQNKGCHMSVKLHFLCSH